MVPFFRRKYFTLWITAFEEAAVTGDGATLANAGRAGAGTIDSLLDAGDGEPSQE
jgi:hypothetical protein